MTETATESQNDSQETIRNEEDKEPEDKWVVSIIFL